MMKEVPAIIGLGYVGLPLAVAVGRKYPGAIGFDISARRIEELRGGRDASGEVEAAQLEDSELRLTSEPSDLDEATFFIVTVPTPIDAANQPDLSFLESACETVGRWLSKGDAVVFESTVYPGVTRDFCGPILQRTSGLKQGEEFSLGYSPERINPGDREHRLETVVKVVAAEDEQALDRVAALYESIVPAGLHRAPSIEVAEAAKVIENTQRDLNIALMNELAVIFDRIGLRTEDVLEAAGTKWNFLNFRPGLVGGHCIGVDPFYLTHKAEASGYHPQIVLAGRRINDSMSQFVAQKAVKLLIENERQVKGARVGVLGLTFKENIPDIRNSRVPEIIDELRDFGVECLVHDPLADPEDAREHCGIELVSFEALRDADALIIAVAHTAYTDGLAGSIRELIEEVGVVLDVKSIVEVDGLGEGVVYWSL